MTFWSAFIMAFFVGLGIGFYAAGKLILSYYARKWRHKWGDDSNRNGKTSSLSQEALDFLERITK